jgi:hypothetical protein
MTACSDGLSKSDYRLLRDLYVKATDSQLKSIVIGVQAELRKRYEVRMAQAFRMPYGSQFVGYRLSDGTRSRREV